MLRLQFIKKLYQMKKLYDATENSFIHFNEFVPYHSNDWKIKSPKLATMMLEVGPQIESMSKILSEELGFKHKKSRNYYFLDYFKELDSKGMLVNQEVMLKENNKILQPFKKTKKQNEWWLAYTTVKHSMPEGLEKCTLNNFLNALAALSSLHHIAHIVKIGPMSNLGPKDFLDYTLWHDSAQEGIDADVDSELRPNFESSWWRTKLFYFPSRRFMLI